MYEDSGSVLDSAMLAFGCSVTLLWLLGIFFSSSESDSDESSSPFADVPGGTLILDATDDLERFGGLFLRFTMSQSQ